MFLFLIHWNVLIWKKALVFDPAIWSCQSGFWYKCISRLAGGGWQTISGNLEASSKGASRAEQSSTPNIQITNLGRTQPQSATLATLRNHIIRQTKSIFKLLQGNCRCCKKLQGCHRGDEEGRSLEGETRATLAFVEELLHPPLLQMIALSHQTTLINVWCSNFQPPSPLTLQQSWVNLVNWCHTENPSWLIFL